jgi:hypothetical protein
MPTSTRPTAGMAKGVGVVPIPTRDVDRRGDGFSSEYSSPAHFSPPVISGNAPK